MQQLRIVRMKQIATDIAPWTTKDVLEALAQRQSQKEIRDAIYECINNVEAWMRKTD